jgi:calcium/calmodulin-dependent protein kinase I
LAHSWLTTHAPSTEHDLSGLRENFDPRARWRQAIGAARLASRLTNGARNKTRAESSDDESEDGAAAQWRQKTDTPKHLGVSSPDHHKPRSDLATLASAAAVAKTPRMSSSLPPFASQPGAKAETEKARVASEDRTTVQTTSQVRKAHGATPSHVHEPVKAAEKYSEVYKEVELRMPGSFDVEDHAGGAAGTGAANDHGGIVSVFGHLLRRVLRA